MDTNEFDFENRIMNTAYSAADSDVEYSLRPKTLDEYVGQEKVKENVESMTGLNVAAVMNAETYEKKISISYDKLLLYGDIED